MRFRFVALLVMTAACPLYLYGQNSESGSARQGETANFVGVWRGEFDNLPGVDLVITNEGGGLHGAVLFYLHRRPDASSSYSATPGLPEPLLDMALDGRTLQFQVSHRHAHAPGSLYDAPMKFHLKLLGQDRAELENESESAPVVVMKRSDY
jgi:hypothetical protein